MFLLKAVLLFLVLSLGFAITNHADQAWMTGPIIITWFMARGAWSLIRWIV